MPVVLTVCYIPFYLSAELMFLETSALTGENVEEAFLKCSRTILSKIETGKEIQFGKPYA